jgi:hypothetical protein
LIVGLLVACFLTSYFVVDFPFVALGLNKELARAEKNGVPLMKEALRPNPVPDPSQNAAPKIIEIAKRASDKVKEAGLTVDIRDPDGYQKYDRALLKIYEPYLKEFVEANQRPGYWVDRDYDDRRTLSFSEFGNLKLVAKVLALRSELRASKGDFDGAIEDLKAGIQLVRHFNDDITLISHLVGMAVYGIEMKTVEKIATQHVNDARFVKRLRVEVVENSNPPTHFLTALKTECYWDLVLTRNLDREGGYRSLGVTTDPPGKDPFRPEIPVRRSGKPRGVVAQAFMVKSLRFWNDLMESKAWKDQDQAAVALEMDRLCKVHDLRNSKRLSESLNAFLIVDAGESPKHYLAAEASKRVTRSFLLVLEYRATKGAYPPSLRAASAEAMDPLAEGKSLQYFTDGKSVKVWSVGKYAKDKRVDPGVMVMYPPRKR